MQIQLVAVGTKMPNWVSAAFTEYQKRMPKLASLNLVEIPAEKRGKNQDTKRILATEAQKISQAIDPRTMIIALDRRGRAIDTPTLAKNLQSWIDESQDVAIVIGGPEGLDTEFLGDAAKSWSLSELTFAHPVVRVMLAEQLYRAWSLCANLPYHRGD